MERVANYFAEIGFRVDRGSVDRANKAFEQIERKLSSFAKTTQTSLGGIGVKVNLDRKSLDRVNRQVRLLERNLRPLNLKVNVPNRVNKGVKDSVGAQYGTLKAQQDALVLERNKALTEAVVGVKKAVMDVQKEVKTLNATMVKQQNRRNTQPSVHPLDVGMGGNRRAPVGTSFGRRSVRGTTQSHTTNTSSGVGSDGLSRRSSSPFHNPFMLGGFTGALTRYGAHALPLFGGVIGAQALTRAAIDSDRQTRSLDMAAAISGTGKDGDYYRAFLDRLGKDLGLASSNMVDSFTYMINTVGGSGLESHMEQGFASIMRYTTVFGKTIQEQDATVKALAKVMTKPYAAADEIRGTPTDNLPFIFRIMAETLAGGDTNKLVEKLSNKEINPTVDFPKVFAAMDREVAPFMGSYFDSPMYARNEYSRLMDNWMTNFLNEGGTEAVNGFLRVLNQVFGGNETTSKIAGNLVDSFSKLMQIVMLAPEEVVDYMKGNFDYENFMEKLFGERKVGDIFDYITGMFETVNFGIKDIVDYFRKDVKGLTPEESEVYEEMGTISQLMAKALMGLGVTPESSIATANFVGTGTSEAVKGYFSKMEEMTRSQVQLVKDLWQGNNVSEGQARISAEFEARDFLNKYGDQLGVKDYSSQKALIEPLTEIIMDMRKSRIDSPEFKESFRDVFDSSLLDKFVNLVSGKGNTVKAFDPEELFKLLRSGTSHLNAELGLTRPQSIMLPESTSIGDRLVLENKPDPVFGELIDVTIRGFQTMEEMIDTVTSSKPNFNQSVTNNINLNVEFTGAEVRDQEGVVRAIESVVKRQMEETYFGVSSQYLNVIN